MTWEEVFEAETLLWFAGTEYGAGPGIGALRRGRLGSGESLKQLSAKARRYNIRIISWRDVGNWRSPRWRLRRHASPLTSTQGSSQITISSAT